MELGSFTQFCHGKVHLSILSIILQNGKLTKETRISTLFYRQLRPEDGDQEPQNGCAPTAYLQFKYCTSEKAINTEIPPYLKCEQRSQPNSIEISQSCKLLSVFETPVQLLGQMFYELQNYISGNLKQFADTGLFIWVKFPCISLGGYRGQLVQLGNQS